jgi:excinuclease ABC subunit C
MTIEQLREKALLLPQQPGVYIMLDRSGEVIYVGKAKALKNRVVSYFRDGELSPKTLVMVSKVDSFDVIMVRNELEALITENQLIKLHKPKYNVLLKDDKGYPYIRVDLREAYPSFEVAAKTAADGQNISGLMGAADRQEGDRRRQQGFEAALLLASFPAEIGKKQALPE